MAAIWTDSSHGIAWRLELETDVLIPGRLVGGKVDVTADGDVDGRGLTVALLAVEHWKHQVTTTDGRGQTSTRVVEEHGELVREPVAVAGELHLGPGDTRSWSFQLPVPPLGPASLDADVAGLDWTVEARIDRPGGMDPVIERPVRVVQPVALLRSGAVPLEQFALFDWRMSSPTGVTGTIAISPVPLCSGAPFTARVVLHAGMDRTLQEIRAEVRVHVTATVSSGLAEDVLAWEGRLATTELSGDRIIDLSGTLDPRALPSVELPHGRTAATFHVILAIAWNPDLHLVRDIAIATTLEL